ncbi:MAG: hypothetical protein ACYTBJ_03615 [Planctomycetota bacterium]|jgi:hypothetical protein
MNDTEAEITPRIAPKPFMAVGPTLHYSHENVQRFWLLSVAVFGLGCLFWSKILTGSFWSFDFQTIISPGLWRLEQAAMTGVSIFEYPWQILVLGLLMGILAVVPVLVSQLLSFSHSLPFVLAIIILANLPAFGVCLLISCVAAACRPLRFRSRFTAVALCTAPQLLYWGYFGGARGVEPIQWGFSFAPWICAWLIGLGIAGLVLGIGHFTRYRPGLVWAATSLFLLAAIITFEIRIGFDELDYQLYVAKNNPEDIDEFDDHSITEALDELVRNPSERLKRHIRFRFYSNDPIQLRASLKKEIQTQLGLETQLGLGRWPWWFIVPEGLDYQTKRQQLYQQYDLFIKQRPRSRRMPIALYYRALLSEYSPDVDALVQREVLHFYNDYPYKRSESIWEELYTEFSASPESIEARWRIAKHRAGHGKFEQADGLLKEARTMVAERLRQLQEEQPQADTLFSLFRPPAESVMSRVKLTELHRRLNELCKLIGSHNLIEDSGSADRLATFVMLNPHSSDYEWSLGQLLAQMKDSDPLRDNVLLAQTILIEDDQLRGEKLAELHKKFQDTDGGMKALYELGRLKIRLYQNESNPERKKLYLTDARRILTSFVSLYPKSFYAEQVQKNLDDLPTVD